MYFLKYDSEWCHTKWQSRNQGFAPSPKQSLSYKERLKSTILELGTWPETFNNQRSPYNNEEKGCWSSTSEQHVQTSQYPSFLRRAAAVRIAACIPEEAGWCQSRRWNHCPPKVWAYRDLPGGPVVKTPCSHCRGHRRFHPWSGN